MKLSRFGRITLAFVAMIAMGLSMTACGGFTVAYIWVLGTQYNQISAFKVDDFTGNLTPSLGSPYSSAGPNPHAIAVRPGGRFVYVLNQGTGTGDGNIAVFTVGGDGNLAYQATYYSQGNTPIWLTVDASGNYLYVLDEFDPTNKPGAVPCSQSPTDQNCATGKGDITSFSIDPDTGRLALVTNSSVKTTPGSQIQLSYFPVGPKPTMLRLSGSSCVYAMDTGDQTIFPYSVAGGGQLNLTTNSSQGIATGAVNLTSITTNGSYVYLTDANPTAASPGGQILYYSVGSGCSLNSVTGGAVNNLAQTQNPVYSLVDNTGKFFYVLNSSTTNAAVPNSSISQYAILPNGQLSPLPQVSVNPITVGAGPICAIEDPSGQYIYTSNNQASTVTGKIINSVTGYLSDLNRGPSFPTSLRPSCLGFSGNTD